MAPGVAERGVVAAGHPLTAAAGADALRAGGNAVDAALAALLTSFMTEPLLTGLGGEGVTSRDDAAFSHPGRLPTQKRGMNSGTSTSVARGPLRAGSRSRVRVTRGSPIGSRKPPPRGCGLTSE